MYARKGKIIWTRADCPAGDIVPIIADPGIGKGPGGGGRDGESFFRNEGTGPRAVRRGSRRLANTAGDVSYPRPGLGSGRGSSL